MSSSDVKPPTIGDSVLYGMGGEAVPARVVDAGWPDASPTVVSLHVEVPEAWMPAPGDPSQVAFLRSQKGSKLASISPVEYGEGDGHWWWP